VNTMPKMISPKFERRLYSRVPLRLPVRIRWRSPLGLLDEASETLEVSRNGILVPRADFWTEHTRLWVTLPFDDSPGTTVQPETPARVVRIADGSGGSVVALELQLPARRSPPPGRKERRSSPRLEFALPISVRRLADVWPETTMTCDVGRTGVRFEATQTYARGEMVRLTLPFDPKVRSREISGTVLRVESAPPVENGGVSPLASVAVAWRPAPGR